MDKINFILDNIPDLYNKSEVSNVYNILNAIAKELDIFVTKLDEVKKAKFVNYASGNDLDKIANILNMKRFNNENDEAFRSRIKSKVPSFIGGGAISSLKQVINNYLGVEPVILEHYKPGEGHPYFDNGVLNGLECISQSSQSVKVKSGASYVNGILISPNETIINLNASQTNSLFLRSNGSFYIANESRNTTYTSIDFDTNISNYVAGNLYTITVNSSFNSAFDSIVNNIKLGIDYVTNGSGKFGIIKSIDKVTRRITIQSVIDYTDGTPAGWLGEGIAIVNNVSYSPTPISSDILLYNIENFTSTIVNANIFDKRIMLNPEEDYITNTASITLQIPYAFNTSNISLEDVKDILRHTKAAGVALLIKIMDTYNDSIIINDNVNYNFIVGFSGIGGNNILGG